jgi:hypothetical protein
MLSLGMDDTLIWNVSSKPDVSHSSIYGHDTFEEYEPGTRGSDIKNWSDRGEIVAKAYTPKQGANKYILKRATHKQVLDAEDGATRSLTPKIATNSKSYRADLMVEVRRPTEDPLGKLSGNPKLVIVADKDGYLQLWHRACYYGSVFTRWSKLGNTKYKDGEWVRVSVETYAPQSGWAFAHVLVNGTACSVPGGNTTRALRSNQGDGEWFPVDSDFPQTLSLVGTKVDDFIIATPGYIETLHPSASIMVAPASGANGAAAAGGQAYTVATAVAAPDVASGAAQSEDTVAAPAIVGFGIAQDGRPSIRFKGFSENAAYRVVRSTSVDFRSESCECPEGVFTTEGCQEGEAIWTGGVPDSLASGAKFYRVEVVEAAAE